MPTRFVCLANSFKEGARCLAGIELDNNNDPVIVNGHSKWIRPICNTPHGEVPTELVSDIEILDILEIEITDYPDEENYQSENVFFDENSIGVIGRYAFDQLDHLCDNRPIIFGNRGKAVIEEEISHLNYSLMLIHTDQFEVVEKIHEDNPAWPKYRVVFTYNGHRYDLPITDPSFIHAYKSDPDVLEDVEEIYLSLSLAVVHNGWHSKLAAGIIYQ